MAQSGGRSEQPSNIEEQSISCGRMLISIILEYLKYDYVICNYFGIFVLMNEDEDSMSQSSSDQQQSINTNNHIVFEVFQNTIIILNGKLTTQSLKKLQTSNLTITILEFIECVVDNQALRKMMDLFWNILKIIHFQDAELVGFDVNCVREYQCSVIEQITIKRGKVALIHVLSCQEMEKLQILRIENHQIGDQLYHRFNQMKFSSLKELCLNDVGLQDKGIKSWSKSHFKNLQKLQLANNSIGNKGCKYLVQLHLQKLEKLSLKNNLISSQGAKFLVNSSWTFLEQLILDENYINFVGLKELGKAVWIKLRYLSVAANFQLLSQERYGVDERFKELVHFGFIDIRYGM